MQDNNKKVAVWIEGTPSGDGNGRFAHRIFRGRPDERGLSTGGRTWTLEKQLGCLSLRTLKNPGTQDRQPGAVGGSDEEESSLAQLTSVAVLMGHTY